MSSFRNNKNRTPITSLWFKPLDIFGWYRPPLISKRTHCTPTIVERCPFDMANRIVCVYDLNLDFSKMFETANHHLHCYYIIRIATKNFLMSQITFSRMNVAHCALLDLLLPDLLCRVRNYISIVSMPLHQIPLSHYPFQSVHSFVDVDAPAHATCEWFEMNWIYKIHLAKRC